MGGLYGRKKGSRTKNKYLNRFTKTKHFKKDIDQIHEDCQDDNRKQLLNQELDVDLPGQGQFYCVECAKYFINQVSIDSHKKSSLHKKQVKKSKLIPYTIQDSILYSK